MFARAADTEKAEAKNFQQRTESAEAALAAMTREREAIELLVKRMRRDAPFTGKFWADQLAALLAERQPPQEGTDEEKEATTNEGSAHGAANVTRELPRDSAPHALRPLGPADETPRTVVQGVTPLRESVRSRLAMCFGDSAYDRDSWRIVANAFDESWPEVARAARPQEPSDILKHLASAMRKVLPPDLLAEVVAHLDPLTPFMEFLRQTPPAPPEAPKEQP